MTVSERLSERLAALPGEPGVYIFHDRRGRPLYIGKAKHLRRRVLSYFDAPLSRDDGRHHPKSGLHPKVAELVRRVDDLEVVVVSSESEALILEDNLVKRHRPPFNIKLRDDKSYPYIGISLDEEFPRVYFTRERHRRDRIYFGPYSSASKVRETIGLINRLFPNRPCEGPEPGRASGVPCLDFHIKRCLAPCVGHINREEYRELIDQTIAFLSGSYRNLERELEEQMSVAAAAEQFERAAAIRDRLTSVRHLMENQAATLTGDESADVIGVAAEGGTASVQVLQVRDGVMQDRRSFFLDGAENQAPADVLEQFALEYYAAAASIPPLVLIPRGLDQVPDLAEALTQRRGAGVEVRSPERGEKRRLAELADRNARFSLDNDRQRHEQARRIRRESAQQLADALGLDGPPIRIEGYDISNLGETNAVASMVVFQDGRPHNSHYRNFTMRYEGGPDDFARMQEALERRTARLTDEEDDASFGSRPSLILIDGGKGQLGAALAGIRASGADDIPIVSISKRQEELWLPGRQDPVLLPENSSGLRLLQQVRDEAHRVALRHHRRRRGSGMTESVFDSLPGVGPARRKAILAHFGSTEDFLSAGPEEMAAVPGLPGKVAREIWDHLHKTGSAGASS